MSKKARNENREARRRAQAMFAAEQAAAAALPTVPGYTVELLPAGGADLPFALDILHEAGVFHGDAFGSASETPKLRSRLTQLNHPSPDLGRAINLIAREDATGEVVGALHARIQPEPLEGARMRGLPYPKALERAINLMSLAVVSAHTQQGLGGRLVTELEARARVIGFEYVTGYGEGDETKLRNFYTRLGYTCEPNGRLIPARFTGPMGYGSFASKRDGFHFWKEL